MQAESSEEYHTFNCTRILSIKILRKVMMVSLLMISMILFYSCDKENTDSKFILKFGHLANEHHVWHKAALFFAETVSRESNGRIGIKVYPGEQLGKELDMITGVLARTADMTITGESACADSWGRALSTRQTSVSLPCFAERRYGGVADDELLIAMPPDEFARGIEGLAALNKNGLRYPIVPYGIQADPSEGMAVSYPGRGR